MSADPFLARLDFNLPATGSAAPQATRDDLFRAWIQIEAGSQAQTGRRSALLFLVCTLSIPHSVDNVANHTIQL